jgi:hypothetical protein
MKKDPLLPESAARHAATMYDQHSSMYDVGDRELGAEMEIARRMRAKGCSPAEIAKAIGRDLHTACGLLGVRDRLKR